jgi:hypothetical protein
MTATGRATYLGQSDIRLLHEWAASMRHSLAVPHLVGSALTTADYRDVDVRVILPDDRVQLLEQLVAVADLNLAWSLWGQKVTGLPIDFQVQSETEAAEHEGTRHPLGVGISYRDADELRLAHSVRETQP